MIWWDRQLERIMTSIGDLAAIFLLKLSIWGREHLLAASCWLCTQRMLFSYIWKLLQKKTAVFWMFWWLNRRCRFCSSSVNPVQLSITWRRHSDALFRLESRHTLLQTSISASTDRSVGKSEGTKFLMQFWAMFMAPGGQLEPFTVLPGPRTHRRRRIHGLCMVTLFIQ